MGLLDRRFALVLLVAPACYSPELRDCTVSCAAESDCATGQVCGSDQLCASPDVAGHCASLPVDGGVPPIRDAAHPVDAETIVSPDAQPDAPTTTTLHVQVEGQGRVVITGIGSCDSAAPQKGDCWFGVLLDAAVSAQAVAHTDWRFDKWTTMTCGGDNANNATCDFTPSAATSITAKFRKDD